MNASHEYADESPPALPAQNNQPRTGLMHMTAPSGGFGQLADETEQLRKSPRPEKPDKELKQVSKNNFFGPKE